MSPAAPVLVTRLHNFTLNIDFLSCYIVLMLAIGNMHLNKHFVVFCVWSL